MGFFPKKKGAKDPQASPLSEAEIHRKLYGEFESEAEAAHVAPVERDHFKDPVTSSPSGKESRTSADLFSVSNNVPAEPEAPARPVRPVIKSPENPSRYVPIHEFEKKEGSTVDPADAYARFRSGVTASKMKDRIFKMAAGIFEDSRKSLAGLMDPKRVMVRRVLTWSAAVLVVFLLFWGVNALNSQREVAMKTQYKRHKEPRQTAAVASKPSSVPAASAVERSVVVTPAAPHPREVVITPAALVKHKEVAANSAGPYSIQVVTYPGKADAEQVVETLKKDKLDAFLKEYKRTSGRVFYVVFIGGYRTEAEAQAQLVKFRAKEVARPFQDAFVKTIS